MVLQSTNIVALMILFQMVYELMENSFRKVQTNLLKIFVLKDSLFWSRIMKLLQDIQGDMKLKVSSFTETTILLIYLELQLQNPKMLFFNWWTYSDAWICCICRKTSKMQGKFLKSLFF